jgi:hypothetical protein
MTVTARFAKRIAGVGVVASMALSVGCGEVSQGQAPVQVVIDALEAASGASPADFGGTMHSDVETLETSPDPCTEMDPCPVIYPDLGQVTMRLVSRDPGSPGVGSNPSQLNAVTINRYHVRFARTDGRNGEGVDVPYSFESAVTFTIPADASATAGFQIVRHAMKLEAPLKALADNGQFISTIAYVTFYGQDLAGNAVTVMGQVGIDFGNYADPD